MTYGPYPAYLQGAGAFVHEVSILDLLFHLGSEARAFISPRREPAERAGNAERPSQ